MVGQIKEKAGTLTMSSLFSVFVSSLFFLLFFLLFPSSLVFLFFFFLVQLHQKPITDFATVDIAPEFCTEVIPEYTSSYLRIANFTSYSTSWCHFEQERAR